MKQSRFTSLLKSLVSTAVGFAVAFLANMLILPSFGLPLSHSANLLLTMIYTVISIARGYLLERFFEAMGWRMKISPFMAAVIAEVQRQRDFEGWSIDHDDRHDRGELARAGAAYLIGPGRFTVTDYEADEEIVPVSGRLLWPWGIDWWKPRDGFRRNIVKGCALGIAEGEKFDRSRKSTQRRTEPSLTDDAESSRSSLVNQINLAHNKTRSQHGGSSA